MAVRFILGTSGTGKSSLCVREIVDELASDGEGRPLIFLVPEQATYQAERAILKDARISGYHRLNVLSFDRLQFLLLGKNAAKASLSRIGRQMIVQRLLRVHGDKLQAFGASALRVGLGKAISETIAELHRYGRSAEDIDEFVATVEKYEPDSLTALKFRDISLIFKEYLRFIEKKFVDPDLQLALARKAVEESKLVKGAKLWVDGFAGFTGAELVILAELLRTVTEAKIALCLDAASIDLKSCDISKIEPTGVFGPTEQTYCQLLELVKKCKLQLAEPVILTEPLRFADSAALGHIEHDLFEPKAQKISADGDVQIVTATNARAEVQFVARRIAELVREESWRYRDIAVIASDLDYYEHYLRAYFEDYGIPYFIDKRRKFSQHPVIRLLYSALAAVAGGLNSSEVFAYLKTGLVPIESYDIDLLENYCIAFGVQGDDWTQAEPWDFAGPDQRFDDGRVDKIRQKAVGPLIELRGKLSSAGDKAPTIRPAEFTKVVFDFLDGLNVHQTLNRWLQEARSRPDMEDASSHQQFCEVFADTFDELVEAFGDMELSCSELAELLQSAFSQTTLAIIPPQLDQVLVGSIERSRHPDLKAVFLIGCTERQFPAPVGYDSILTDADRAAAQARDFLLGRSRRDELAQREYLAYIALTRAAEYLCASFPAVDEKGRANVCSRYIANLQRLFEGLESKFAGLEKIDIEHVHNEAELQELLCGKLGRDRNQSRGEQEQQLCELLSEMQTDKQLCHIVEPVASALGYDNKAELSKEVVKELFGEVIESSATKLSTFAACPYQYFARYVLELEERKEFKFEPLDKGTFYHRVLDLLVKRLCELGINLGKVEDGRLIDLLKEQIERSIVKDTYFANFRKHSRHNAYIIASASEALEEAVLAMAEMARAGSFRPRLSEVSFGQDDSILGQCRIGLGRGRELLLRGKIDRLDVAADKLVVVFDYKLSDRPFSWSQFYHGIDMQLPIYMLAVRNNTSSSIPRDTVGAFYIPIESSAQSTGLSEVEKLAQKFSYKAKGLFDAQCWKQLDSQTTSKDSRYYNFYITKDGEPYGRYSSTAVLKEQDFAAVIDLTQRKICDLVAEIISGRIEVNPYRLGTKSPCGWCKYRAVCRFDWQINDYRALETVRKLDVIEKAKSNHV